VNTVACEHASQLTQRVTTLDLTKQRHITMAGPTVYTDVADDFDFSSGGQLFEGKKFFVNQRVPLRNRLLDDIRANGGEIVKLEKQADYRIADHVRRDCPPGTISYEFVTKSIKNGELCDPENHRAGPREGESRAPGGSTYQPAKSGRTAYTAEEDRILYKWVRDSSAGGGLVSGNEIYKQLEAKVGGQQKPLQDSMLIKHSIRDILGSHGATDISSS
jgi:hypothetical protein